MGAVGDFPPCNRPLLCAVCDSTPIDDGDVMSFEWKWDAQGLDWQALSELYRIAPLGEKHPQDLQTAFSNSRYMCFVFDTGRLIGAGRVLADGVDCAYICDLAVHPDYQGQGIGKDIVSRLVEMSQGHSKIILYTSPGKEAFYEHLGFKPLTAALAIFADPDYAKEDGVIKEP